MARRARWSRREDRAQIASWSNYQTRAQTLMVESLPDPVLQRFSRVERVTGIEPALSAWEADVLPLNYTRAALLGALGEHSRRTGRTR